MNLHKTTLGLLASAALLVCCVSGCSRGPKGPNKPKLDPGAAAAAAIAEYDTDHDGLLSQEELREKCPGLLDALKRAHPQGDGKLSAEDIAARIDGWFRGGIVLLPGLVQVTLDGRPLDGATVTLEPEKFLADALKSASGVTNAAGQAFLSGADEKFPGIYPGVYRVRISRIVGGKETVPKKYNTDSQLGTEMASDIREPGGLVEFQLKSR